MVKNWDKEFLSTPSARRATGPSRSFLPGCRYFYPRPPRGGRPQRTYHVNPERSIFLSTPSARRATRARSCACRCDTISIHALREEGDADTGCTIYLDFDFYPRPPRGGRRKGSWETCCITSYFYPRPPRGGRPADPPKSAGERNFYPRPPRGGRRAMAGAWKLSRRNFYPRPPRGGRRGKTTVLCELLLISIHALREEGDPRCRKA